jgi:hypothetical protein
MIAFVKVYVFICIGLCLCSFLVANVLIPLGMVVAPHTTGTVAVWCIDVGSSFLLTLILYVSAALMMIVDLYMAGVRVFLWPARQVVEYIGERAPWIPGLEYVFGNDKRVTIDVEIILLSMCITVVAGTVAYLWGMARKRAGPVSCTDQ